MSTRRIRGLGILGGSRLHKQLVLLVCSALAFGLLAAGCGGGGSGNGSGGAGSSRVSASTYVAGLCKATIAWADTARAQEQQLTQQITAKLPSILASGLSGQSNPLAPFRTSLVKFLGDFVSATTTYQKQIHAAGTPDVKNGSALAAGLNTAANKLVADLTALRGQAQQISIDNGSAFQRGADAIASKSQADISGFGNSLNFLSNAQLDAAAMKNPACAKLISSG